MGSEEDGISNDILKASDHIVKLPMFGKTSSLNVSVASGVFCMKLSDKELNFKFYL